MNVSSYFVQHVDLVIQSRTWSLWFCCSVTVHPLFLCRWEAVQLSLGRLRQKVCPFWWAFPPSPDAHWREEVCLQCVWPALHAQWPPDQTRPPAHDHQESVLVAGRIPRPQQTGPTQGPAQELCTSCQLAGPLRQLMDSVSGHRASPRPWGPQGGHRHPDTSNLNCDWTIQSAPLQDNLFCLARGHRPGPRSRHSREHGVSGLRLRLHAHQTD